MTIQSGFIIKKQRFLIYPVETVDIHLIGGILVTIKKSKSYRFFINSYLTLNALVCHSLD